VISISERWLTAAVLLMTVNENIPDSRATILIEISLREIIRAVYGMILIEIGPRVNTGSRRIAMEAIPVTVRTLARNIGLKICIDGVLQKPRKKPQSLFVKQDAAEVPREMNRQITVEERLPAMGL